MLGLNRVNVRSFREQKFRGNFPPSKIKLRKFKTFVSGQPSRPPFPVVKFKD